MDSWDIVLLVVAGYLGTMTLVRLMIHRRDQMRGELRAKASRQHVGGNAARNKDKKKPAGSTKAA